MTDLTSFNPFPKTRDQLRDEAHHVKWMYERLVMAIKDFEAKLDSAHEIGAMLGAFAGERVYVEDLGYHGPDLLIVYGRTQAGQPVTALQHVSQTSFILVAMPLQPGHTEPRRIGFKLEEKDLET
jgi:hypothetical protein